MKKSNSAIYIPNMDAKEFDKVCAEKGLQFIYIPVPPHGRLIDADVLSQMFDPDESFGAAVLEIIADTPTIIPAELSEEQREYEAQVEAAQYCEMYEPSYDPETGAL